MDKALKAIFALQANTIQTLVAEGDYRRLTTAEAFLKTNPSKITTVDGAVVYEDPEDGDEAPPIVVFSGEAYRQYYYDIEDIRDALSFSPPPLAAPW